MKRTRLALLVVLILAAGVRRLPAPVEEISSPTPTAAQKPKITSAPRKLQKPSPGSQPVVQFAGRWRGVASGRINQALFGQRDFSSNYDIEISSDERTINWTSSAWISARFHAVAKKDGRALSWTTDRHDIAGRTSIICRLEQMGTGIARYSESSGLVNGTFKGAGYELSGMLTKQ